MTCVSAAATFHMRAASGCDCRADVPGGRQRLLTADRTFHSVLREALTTARTFHSVLRTAVVVARTFQLVAMACETGGEAGCGVDLVTQQDVLVRGCPGAEVAASRLVRTVELLVRRGPFGVGRELRGVRDRGGGRAEAERSKKKGTSPVAILMVLPVVELAETCVPSGVVVSVFVHHVAFSV